MNSDWLIRALEESRARGFLGPTEIDNQIAHARGFSRAWTSLFAEPPASFVDLGSGGGLPGLVLLDEWRNAAVFTDSMMKRTNFLSEVLTWDEAPQGATVVVGRAEEVSRREEFEERFSLVTARSFGPPSVTAECACRFLAIGGLLIVSEPPHDSDGSRWSGPALAKLGLESEGRVRFGSAFQILHKVRSTPAYYPRSIGVPGKSPLF